MGQGDILPLGLNHIFLRLNSLTRASSGVIVAHFTATEYFKVASAASTVTLSSVLSRYSIPYCMVSRCTQRERQVCELTRS